MICTYIYIYIYMICTYIYMCVCVIGRQSSLTRETTTAQPGHPGPCSSTEIEELSSGSSTCVDYVAESNQRLYQECRQFSTVVH